MPEGIFAVCFNTEDDKRKDFWKTYTRIGSYHQHFNEKNTGWGVSDGNIIISGFKPGLFKSVFEDKRFDFLGNQGIGYCGSCFEPLIKDTRIGELCICFSGIIPEDKRNILQKKLKKQGISFSSKEGNDRDVEIIANIIAQGKVRGKNPESGVIDGIKKLSRTINTYNLLILTKNKVFVARSPDAHWPLTLSESVDKDSVLIISTTTGLDNFNNYRISRDIRPGEIGSICDGKYKTEAEIPTDKINVCSFFSVYSDYVFGTLQTGNFKQIYPKRTLNALIRERLGESLARRDIFKEKFFPDLILPIKDSGISAGLGYFHAFWRAWKNKEIFHIPLYAEILVKYTYSPRSFNIDDREKRREEAYYKILTGGVSKNGLIIETLIKRIADDILSLDIGKIIVVLVDDSVVRGTQTGSDLVPKLESIGIKIIHLRSSFPLIFAHCPWGKTTKAGECLATRIFSEMSKKENLKEDESLYRKMEDKVAEKLNIKTARFTRISDLVKAVGIDYKMLCLDCISFPKYKI